MKSSLLTILRDKHTPQNQFRSTSDKLAEILAAEAAEHMEMHSYMIETPIASTKGFKPKHSLVLLPILRSGIALLSAFMRLFDEAQVGFFGIRRNETTTLPYLYYENLPSISPQGKIIILDPMLATGSSALLAIEKLVARGIDSTLISLVNIVAAPEGIHRIKKIFPKTTIISAAVDEKLNAQKLIVPGLGDYGDRYFGVHIDVLTKIS